MVMNMSTLTAYQTTSAEEVLSGSTCKIRNVGQCPTWWPPCQI